MMKDKGYFPFFLSCIILVIGNVVWRMHPNLWTAIIFACGHIMWIILFIFAASKLIRLYALLAFMGSVLNDIVVISNGGFMPVPGKAHGVYVSGGNLTFLGDYYPLGMSPGDMLLFSSLGILLIWALMYLHLSATVTKQIGIIRHLHR